MRKTVWGNNFVMWKSTIGGIISEEMGSANWIQFQEEANKLYGHAGGLQKNTLHIGTTLSMAWDAGKRSSSLERLCEALLVPEAATATETVAA